MQRLTFVCHVNTYSGYGQMTMGLIKKLVERDYDISIRATKKTEPFGAKIPLDILTRIVKRVQSEPWEIVINPPEFTPTQGKKTLFFTMWESSRLKPVAKQLLDRAQVICVSSDWNASCFSACGINAPIRVVPQGIDTDIYHYRSPKPKKEFVFGMAGRIGAHPLIGGGARKGVEDVVRCFTEAFLPSAPVKLRIKVFPDDNIGGFSNDPRIEFTRSFMDDAQLIDWYAGIDCFVTCSRGEGWGLMPHQAMAVGRPVIGCVYGGHAEFMNEFNSFPLEFIHAPANYFYDGCGTWSEPSKKHLKKLMRHCFENPDKVEERGLIASQSVKKFNMTRMVDAFESVLKEFKIVV